MTTGPDFSLVVVGCSAGGLEATMGLLAGLEADANLTVVVAQHRTHRPSNIVDVLGPASPWPVSEPDDKERIYPFRVYVAPAGYHLFVEGDHFELSTEAPVRFSRPSIDLALSSAALSYKERLVAVVLTGANADGAAGALEAARRGGRVVVQDPSSAFAAEMPRATLDSGVDALVFPLDQIGQAVGRLVAERTTGRGRL